MSILVTTVNTAPFLMPNILAANIRGGLCNKLDELSAIFDNNSVDIGCISETWLKASIDHSDFDQLPDQSIRAYPLRQVVVSATRGKALLDKIFTNMYDWYSTPAKLPARLIMQPF